MRYLVRGRLGITFVIHLFYIAFDLITVFIFVILIVFVLVTLRDILSTIINIWLGLKSIRCLDSH